MSVRILLGDCRQRLADLPDGSVHCVVTSPPYFGLRDYGMDGQVGLENTPQAFVDEMVAVFREVRRVLRDDGTLWLNLGDTYNAGGRGGNPTKGSSTLQGGHSSQEASMVRRVSGKSTLRGNGHQGGGPKLQDTLVPNRRACPQGATGQRANRRQGMLVKAPVANELKPKDLIGIPWRVAFALQADGWYLRQDIIWAKPNPMPESVTDRCTKSHEYIFLFSKSERYHYDQTAVLEPIAAASIDRLSQDVDAQQGSHRVPGKTNGTMKAVSRSSGNKARKPRPDAPAEHGGDQAGSVPWEGSLRNKRSVWSVATKPYTEAHFATYPPELIEPCVKAGTSEKGCCAGCGAPWRRRVEVKREPRGDSFGSKDMPARYDHGQGGKEYQQVVGVETVGWEPDCQCPVGLPMPCVVLDPFGGAGTTALVADRMQRNAILCELNPAYADMARRRIEREGGMLTEVVMEK